MSFTILIFIAVVVVNVISAQKKAKQKELRRKMMQNPTDFSDEETEERNLLPSETLRRLLEKYADAHPEDVQARKSVQQAKAQQSVGEITVEQLSDAAYEERLDEERIQALMDYRLEQLHKLKKKVGISKQIFEYLQKKCLDPELSDDEFEEILKNTEIEQLRKRTVARKFVPDNCEMQKTLQAKVNELSKDSIRAKTPVLAEEVNVIASHETSVAIENFEIKKSCKPKFRMTTAEARRGVILAKILEEPRFKKRWSPVSR